MLELKQKPHHAEPVAEYVYNSYSCSKIVVGGELAVKAAFGHSVVVGDWTVAAVYSSSQVLLV
jgi:hypothetical protein